MGIVNIIIVLILINLIGINSDKFVNKNFHKELPVINTNQSIVTALWKKVKKSYKFKIKMTIHNFGTQHIKFVN